MNKALLTAAAAVLTLTAVSFGQNTNNNGNGSTSRQSFDQDYKAVVERNPFSRERHAPVTRTRGGNGNGGNTPRPSRASTFVLRGVSIEDDELHAYFEPTRGGELRRVAPGDTFEDGRIVGIAIDAVAYESNGQVKWVEIGQDLTGTRGAAVASSGSGSSSNSTPTATPDATSQPGTETTDNALPPGGGSLAERMRARARAQRGNRQ